MKGCPDKAAFFLHFSPLNTATIKFEEIGIYTIQVLDINGRVLLNTKINGKQTTLNTSSWPSGVYNLIIKHEKGNLESKRIVKQ